MKTTSILLIFFVLMAIYDVKVFGFRLRRSPKTEKTNDEPMLKRSLSGEYSVGRLNEKYSELKKRVKELLTSEEKEEERAERQQREQKKRGYPMNLPLEDY